MVHPMERITLLNGTGRFIQNVGFPAAIAAALLYILDQHITTLTTAVTTNQLTLLQILDTLKNYCE
jgi:hypothetical protein